jgi:aconitate hydratase
MENFKNQLTIFNSQQKTTSEYTFFDIEEVCRKHRIDLLSLPYSIRVLLENLVRNLESGLVSEENVQSLLNWNKEEKKEIPFIPSRVIMQDYSGFPAVLDLASMRQKVKESGRDPSNVNPIIPAELIVDHSLIVKYARSQESFDKNLQDEFTQNNERYKFMKWAAKSFDNFKVVPPSRGIVHQINLEYLGEIIKTKVGSDNETYIFPDTLVGTDSHTPMINGLGIVGWGVGGIEAEAAMLGQPIFILTPDVVGVEIIGELTSGVTGTDLVLFITQLLRAHGVVGKFVEFFGDGIDNLLVPDRATISNMAPEYGATIAYFPIDKLTIDYLNSTGRSEDLISLVKNYSIKQKLFREKNSPIPDYTEIVKVDLSKIQPSIAGPKRPQDRIVLSDVKSTFLESLVEKVENRGYGLNQKEVGKEALLNYKNKQYSISHGAIMIAAITSCTNTSNPTVMIGAGLLAKRACELDLEVPEYIKTSLAPGSRVVTEYLKQSNLLPYLEKLGFNVVGYGCTTCVGNTGPLEPEIIDLIEQNQLIASSILSGNRNFEGRIHSHTKANFLASPPLVVAYALAGRIDIDFENEPIGLDKDNNEIYLKDIWPSQEEINQIASIYIKPELFRNQYSNIFVGNQDWINLDTSTGELYDWDNKSTYIKNTPFFNDNSKVEEIGWIEDTRVLLKLGDSITTDHISPVGSIPESSPAGIYLKVQGVNKEDFNAYGARRGNHDVMARGTFANIRLNNLLLDNKEGWFTKHFPSGEEMTIFDASQEYQKTNTPLIIIAGKDYGMGSARDWAAKGTALLGVKAVIFESIERIHRSNLVGMGVLPLQFLEGENSEILEITGNEIFTIEINNEVRPGDIVQVTFENSDGTIGSFRTGVRLDTSIEVEYYRNGGILNYVLRNILNN